MRRVDFLINEIRRNTNNKNTNKFSDFDIVRIMNRIQDEIEKIAHLANTNNYQFNKEYILTTITDQESYDLPDDIFGQSSISGIGYSSDGISYSPLVRIDSKERGFSTGYFIIDKKIYLSPIPSNSSNYLRIEYKYNLPKLSKRFGKVASFISGTSVTITGFTGDLSQEDDYFCIVSNDGTIKESALLITGFNTGTGVISTSSTFSSITTDDYVAVGKMATIVPQLPDSCESFLLMGSERKITANESSTDFNYKNAFTSEERSILQEMFSATSADPIVPPVVVFYDNTF